VLLTFAARAAHASGWNFRNALLADDHGERRHGAVHVHGQLRVASPRVGTRVR
jgi:hypothetical protein